MWSGGRLHCQKGSLSGRSHCRNGSFTCSSRNQSNQDKMHFDEQRASQLVSQPASQLASQPVKPPKSVTLGSAH